MKKLTALLGLAAGYVLGARAGRARYEQIAAKARKAWESPQVQAKAQQATDLAKSAAGTAGTAAFEKARDAATTAATTAKTKATQVVRSRSGGDSADSYTDDYTEDVLTSSPGLPPLNGSPTTASTESGTGTYVPPTGLS